MRKFDSGRLFKLTRALVLIILLIIGIFLIVTNFSTVESRYECPGKVSYKGTTQAKTVYIKIVEYRWWIFWTDSDATLNVELPNELLEYYGYIKKVGDQLLIYEEYPQRKLKGMYYTLSKTLAIDLESPFGFFDGICNTND